jgi:DNA-damage-inducible protein J
MYPIWDTMELMKRSSAEKKDPKNEMIRARTTRKLKLGAERIFNRLGLSSTEAINLFYAQVCLRGGIPFSLEIPNELTLKTMQKTEEGKDLVYSEDVDQMFSKLGI